MSVTANNFRVPPAPTCLTIGGCLDNTGDPGWCVRCGADLDLARRAVVDRAVAELRDGRGAPRVLRLLIAAERDLRRRLVGAP